MIDLKGHRALVTGSSSGVGRAIALAFAEAGAEVVVHGVVKDSAGMQVIESCRKFGVQTEWIEGDLSQSDGVEKVFADAIRAMPGIDIVANNAGWFRDVPFLQMTSERLGQTFALNVVAPYFLTQRFAARWVENNVRGRVIMTGSINGRLAEEGSTAYDASKGAVEMMVKTLAVALAKHRIRVNGVAPGLVRTAATAWLDQRPETAKWLALHIPNGQIPEASVCGPAAVYLCSDAAEHVTGQMLLVDGGMSAWQQPRGAE
ncbi:MAG TPA: SDR family oxidoreductase [Tepidisphaeraceae bacterium]|jgi:NAD(P)-dependent dehydrogenase (short-subunit alcohol dehydrogenase family)